MSCRRTPIIAAVLTLLGGLAVVLIMIYIYYH